MKIKGTIYLYAVQEKDLDTFNRKDLREHLSRPTAGRLFLNVNAIYATSIPFTSISHLMQILHKFRIDAAVKVLDKSLVPICEGTKELDNRRCLRVSIEDINSQNDPMKYASYLGGKLASCRVKHSGFSDESTGVMILPDTDVDYKYHKMYFTDFFDAGVKLSKAFSAEVNNRIPLEVK